MNVENRSLRRTALSLCIAGGFLVAATAQAASISGAIFTTNPAGSMVNGNNYLDKLDVYLNGGPNKGPCSASRLDNDDDYYFQVTDPSGQVLLSTDGIGARRFGVSASGVINGLGDTRIPPEPPGTHATGTDAGPCSNVTVQLMPYADTPNPGGVYKVWITRVTDYVAGCETTVSVSCGHFGFVPGNTKTDNFRTRRTVVPPPTGDLEAFKYYDANVNGAYDPGIDTPLGNWPMTLDHANGPSDQSQLTGGSGLAVWVELDPGVFTVTEGEPTQAGWFNSQPGIAGNLALDGDSITTPITQTTTVYANQTSRVDFGNFCVAGSGGLTLGFWSNKNGQVAINDPSSPGGPLTMAPELSLLTSLNLRNASGGNADFTTYPPFKNWLLAANATNMAYMLSAQLAAMELNVEAGYVDGNALYLGYGSGITINALMAAANTSLLPNGVNGGYTVASGPVRTYQEGLKTALDRLNNGASVVPTSPCSYSFLTPPY